MQGQQVSHYRLTEKLGAGTYGEVWKGVHVDDPNFIVAVKLVSPQVREDPSFLTALRQECRALDRMDHPSIVRFRELVVRDGTVAMVLELLEGADLEASLAAGPQPVDEVVRILDKVLDGLAYAHSKGVVHRDIKPGNIYRCSDGRVKLMDFGIARAADGTKATQTGTLKGTLDYMAPERFANQTTPASDVYAVGLVAWELLSGRRAAPEGDLAAKVGWHMGVGIPDIITVRADCPAWLAEVVATLGAKEVSVRPVDGAAALALMRSRRSVGAPEAGTRPAPVAPGTVEVSTAAVAASLSAAQVAASLPPQPPSTGPSTVVLPAGASLPPSTPPTGPGSLPLGEVATASKDAAPPEPVRSGGSGRVLAAVAAVVVLGVGGWFLKGELDRGAADEAPAVASAGTEWTGPSGYAMVGIPAGSFTMGSPASEEGRFSDETEHRVTLSKGFWMGKTEVTQGLWRAVMGSNPSVEEYKGVSLLGDGLPVQNVSWCDAVAFANKLSSRDGLSAAYSGVDQCNTSKGTSVRWERSSDGYRLPTEAEWEYAARAGEHRLFSGAESYEKVCGVGNVSDLGAKAKFSWSDDWSKQCSDRHHALAPVGAYSANPWGLHDMTGNVYEWCWDWYADYSGTSTDPVGAQSGTGRVNRGGSWVNTPRGARVADRSRNTPGYRRHNLGLRLVRTSP